MDRHFRLADGADNVCLLAAFADQIYANRLECQTRAVFAYDERLRLLPDYLQQLEMESNGKSVTFDGKPLAQQTAPITWGGVGTDAQHAVFQLLHQGTHLTPVEFVVAREPDHLLDDAHHETLVANCIAQGAALMTGRASTDGARNYRENRPSTTILLDQVTPAQPWRAHCFLRASRVRQRRAARDQPVRSVRGRAGQGKWRRASPKERSSSTRRRAH
jgi:glucose-6-phosphate isomerase